MDAETVKGIVELVAAAMWPIGFGAIIWQRVQSGKTGLGARIIQLSAVIMLVPAIVILGLEGIFDSATLGTLIGGLVGYVLSGVGQYQPSRDADSN
jgi:hypothetical protein